MAFGWGVRSRGDHVLPQWKLKAVWDGRNLGGATLLGVITGKALEYAALIKAIQSWVCFNSAYPEICVAV